MKTFKSLLAVIFVAVLMVSCATTQSTTDGLYDDEGRSQQIGNRLYVQDPFYGTIVLERDPFSGRYFDVTYGNRGFASPYYNGYNSYRRYGAINRHYGNRHSGVIQQQPVRQQPSREQIQPQREEARKKILGN